MVDGTNDFGPGGLAIWSTIARARIIHARLVACGVLRIVLCNWMATLRQRVALARLAALSMASSDHERFALRSLLSNNASVGSECRRATG